MSKSCCARGGVVWREFAALVEHATQIRAGGRTSRPRCVHQQCVTGSRHAWAIVIGLCNVYVVGTRRIVDEPVCLTIAKHWKGRCRRAPARADCPALSAAPDAAAAIAGAACLDAMQAEDGIAAYRKRR
jgi:hypothetical protein